MIGPDAAVRAPGALATNVDTRPPPPTGPAPSTVRTPARSATAQPDDIDRDRRGPIRAGAVAVLNGARP